MRDDELKATCKKLKPLLGQRADALWLAYVTAETAASKYEAAATIELLAARYLSAHVDDGSILLPPPPPDAAVGDILLGHVVYGRKELFPLFLRHENFVKHVGIFSITGGGKTNVAYLLVLGLLKQKVPFVVVDWKRSYRGLLSLNNPSVRRLRIFSVGRKTASTFNWNPLRGPPGVHPKTWISTVAEALERSHISGPGVADIFIDLFNQKFEQFGVYEGTHTQFPNFFDAREELDRAQFKGRRMLWQDSCSRILKTFTFGPAAGAFNARNPVKLETLLDEPVIIELDAELPKPLRVFFSDLILRWIHLYRLGQGETESLRHVTFLEEIHNLFPRTMAEKQTTNSLENVYREIRGFGEGLVSITQHPSLLPVYVLGNCNTQIYLGLQHEDDIVAAKNALFLERADEVFLDRLTVGEGIVKIKGRVNPCHVRFPLVEVAKGSIADDMVGGAPDGETGVD